MMPQAAAIYDAGQNHGATKHVGQAAYHSRAAVVARAVVDDGKVCARNELATLEPQPQPQPQPESPDNGTATPCGTTMIQDQGSTLLHASSEHHHPSTVPAKISPLGGNRRSSSKEAFGMEVPAEFARPLEMLVEMGFSSGLSFELLQKHGGDVTKTMEDLDRRRKPA